MARVQVSELTIGVDYVTYRYDGIAALPHEPPFDVGCASATRFKAAATTHTFQDSTPFPSDSAVYYVTVPAGVATTRLSPVAEARQQTAP